MNNKEIKTFKEKSKVIMGTYSRGKLGKAKEWTILGKRK